MFRFDDHTADVKLSLSASTLSELFAEAGRAVASLLAGDVPLGGERPPIPITLEARDLDRLLVDWIDELVFRSESEGQVLDRFDPIEVTPEGRLSAVARGRSAEAIKTQVKAATLHGLRIEPARDGWSASVVLDV